MQIAFVIPTVLHKRSNRVNLIDAAECGDVALH
jgi:hypothetical protein